MVTRVGELGDVRDRFPGYSRPGQPLMSEGGDRVSTPWWLDQVG